MKGKKRKNMNKCTSCSRFLACDLASEEIEECEMFISDINHIPFIY